MRISPRPRVIVITARDDLAARATAMAIGPVAFFIKPFNDEEFLAAVREALDAGKELGAVVVLRARPRPRI